MTKGMSPAGRKLTGKKSDALSPTAANPPTDADKEPAGIVYQGVLVDDATCRAVCDGKQSHVLSTFQCRSVSKDAMFFLLGIREETPAAKDFFAGARMKSPKIIAVALIAFVGNKRLDDAKLCALGEAGRNALPYDGRSLTAAAKKLGKDMTKKFWHAWEIKLVKTFTPPLVLSLKHDPTSIGATQDCS